MKVYLIVSLDTECDKGPHWRVRRPLSFTNILEGIPERLQPIFKEYGIKPTYLLSPEVIRDKECAALFASMGDSVELGTHLHSEFIEPQAEMEAEVTASFQSDYSPETEFQKLKNLTELFYRQFGYNPKSFRAGRFGISEHTLAFLERLGYTVDSSVTPSMWWWRRRGEGVNFLGAPNQPYHPSEKDFRKLGAMRILEVPVTLINPFWDKFPMAIRLFINPVHRPQTIMLNYLFKNRLRCSWLRPTYSTAQKMMEITDYLYQQAEKKSITLCMMFHSNEATAGTSPYHETETEVSLFLGKLRSYFEILLSKYEVHSIELSKAIRILGVTQKNTGRDKH